jgi:HAD superfamily hydrolase (TIGR01490 family)
MIQSKRKVAIFDIDGTIFRSSLFIELVEELVKQNIFPNSCRKMYIDDYNAWVNRKGTYEKYISSVIKAFTAHLKGTDYKEFERIGNEVATYHKDKVYRYTRDLVKILKKKGYFLLAISQSPKGMLDAFCKRLGFNKIYGRFYELGPSDKFTGEVVDLHLIANKANIVRRAVSKENLTLKGSIGVGDTEGDIPMLELVENPICFNPNAQLYRIAKLNKWKIIVERKDVIYEIQ